MPLDKNCVPLPSKKKAKELTLDKKRKNFFVLFSLNRTFAFKKEG